MNNVAQNSKPRWFYAYIFLALFDLVTVAISLYLNDRIISIFKEAAIENRQWAEYQESVTKLAELALNANAPGNDLFETKNLEKEMSAYNKAKAEFLYQLESILTTLYQEHLIEQTQGIVTHLKEAKSSYDNLDLEVSNIFDKYAQNNFSAAASHMSLMDRRYAELASHISLAAKTTQNIQLNYFEKQQLLAHQLKYLEWTIGGCIILMVFGAGIYGKKLLARIQEDETKRQETEKKLLEYAKNLEIAKKEAEISSEHKTQFLANMSHEIRTPINGVLGMLELLGKTQLTQEQKYRVNLAQMSSKSLLAIINDILDFSKVEAGKIEIEAVEFCLRSLIDECVDGFSLQAQSKHVVLSLDATTIEDSPMIGDPGRLRQILSNLISNAVKFTDKGEINIIATLSSNEKNQWVLYCSISDTGIGIPKAALNKLFDSFTQVDASTTRKFGGTGLGLSIVKNLCELMQGEIKVESEEGNGSTFEFSVILKKASSSEKVPPPTAIKARHVMVIEPNESNRSILQNQLERWGAFTLEAKDLSEALIQWQDTIKKGMTIEIILVSLEPQRLDYIDLGEQFNHQLGETSPKLIAMTTIDANNEEQLLKNGYTASFTKPFTYSKLYKILTTVSTNNTAENMAISQEETTSSSTELEDDSHLSEQDSPPWPEISRILLVEDMQINQAVASGILDQLGLDSEIANHGQEAIETLKNADHSNPYTLILMDCQMPQMDGYEATTRIRNGEAGQKYSSIPIIAMTANVMTGDRKKCLDVGMDDYIAKPIEFEILKKSLEKWLCSTNES